MFSLRRSGRAWREENQKVHCCYNYGQSRPRQRRKAYVGLYCAGLQVKLPRYDRKRSSRTDNDVAFLQVLVRDILQRVDFVESMLRSLLPAHLRDIVRVAADRHRLHSGHLRTIVPRLELLELEKPESTWI